jgi:hypothetical protein
MSNYNMQRIGVTEQSIAEASAILKLWSSTCVDPKKKALLAPVIDLLSVKRDAPGGKQVTFFVISDAPQPKVGSLIDGLHL